MYKELLNQKEQEALKKREVLMVLETKFLSAVMEDPLLFRDAVELGVSPARKICKFCTNTLCSKCFNFVKQITVKYKGVIDEACQYAEEESNTGKEEKSNTGKGKEEEYPLSDSDSE